MIRRLLLIARTILIEALRRREIYVIVLLTTALLAAVAGIRFFRLDWLHKFYAEVSLKTMSVAAAVTVIVLAARQLPREFERRTIYPLLARPVARWEFIAGKYLGVLAAGGFCLALFMTVYLLGRLGAGAGVGSWTLFLQFVYLQMVTLAVLAAMAFLLSMLMGLDAAITTAVLLFLLGHVITNAFVVLNEYAHGAGRTMLVALNYAIPQPALLDLSAKVVHEWPPVSAGVLALATFYGALYIVPALALSYALFRRRPL